jgi:predicted transposase YdaD
LEAYEYSRIHETDDKAEKMLVEEKAKMQEKLEIAKNFIELGLDNNLIVKGTGLTFEQVEQLRSETEG